VRSNADTVPHGNHVDFVVGDRLIHIVTGAGSGDCGADCTAAGGGRHAAEASMVDHGRLDITRRRIGSSEPEDQHGDAGGAAGAGSDAGARSGHAGIGGGRYMPLVQKQKPNESAFASESSSGGVEFGSASAAKKEELLSVEAVHLAVNMEHTGGGEASTHTRLKVHGICCPSEVPLIHSILDRKPGVRGVKAGAYTCPLFGST